MLNAKRFRLTSAVAVLVFLALGLLALLVFANDHEPLTQDELAKLESLGPWPPNSPVKDPSNALSRTPEGIAFGRALFLNPKLSINGQISCMTCHLPPRGLSDGLALSKGLGELTRNSQGLWNLAGQRWFGWDGASDSLWSHSLKPMLHPDEMGASNSHIANTIRDTPQLATLLSKPPAHHSRLAESKAKPDEDTVIAMSAAKSMAAFMETFTSPRTAFDGFRDLTVDGKAATEWTPSKTFERGQKFPLEAYRGMKIFLGKGNCIACHAGPKFTNGEFASNGMPHMMKNGVDPGRHGGLQKLMKDDTNLLGAFSDVAPNDKTHTKYVQHHHDLFGQFKVPSLRELIRSAPYMHDGSVRSLADVVKHYSEVNPERIHADGEALIKPLKLTAGETADLVAFLRTLSFQPVMQQAPGQTPSPTPVMPNSVPQALGR